MQFHRDMRIQSPDHRGGAVDLRRTDVGRAVDDLALQVGERDRVVVHDPDGADAGRREIEQRRRAEPARADYQHARALERVLAGPAHLVQHDVAGITFEFLRREHGAAYSTSPDRNFPK